MGPFAGYSMPLQYKDSVMDNTTAVRTEAGIFDVSHMCGLRLTGAVGATTTQPPTLWLCRVASCCA